MGVMTALVLVTELGSSKKIDRFFPHSNVISDDIIVPDFSALPRVGVYVMEKVQQNLVQQAKKIKCEICNI